MSSYSARILQTHWKLRAPRVSPYHSVVMLLTLLAATPDRLAFSRTRAPLALLGAAGDRGEHEKRHRAAPGDAHGRARDREPRPPRGDGLASGREVRFVLQDRDRCVSGSVWLARDAI